MNLRSVIYVCKQKLEEIKDDYKIEVSIRARDRLGQGPCKILYNQSPFRHFVCQRWSENKIRLQEKENWEPWKRWRQCREKRHLKIYNCATVAILNDNPILSCRRSTLQLDSKAGAPSKCAQKIEFMLFTQAVVITVNVVISCCCFAEDSTDLFVNACCTCSTLIFPRSTNQDLN